MDKRNRKKSIKTIQAQVPQGKIESVQTHLVKGGASPWLEGP